MSYEELALFVTTTDRSYPFISEEAAYENDRLYGRRVTNVSYDAADNAFLTYADTGETAVILGHNFIPGILVLCARVNHQWYAIRPAFRQTSSQVILSGEFKGGEQQREGTGPFLFPESVELITTGENKADLDGLYPLIPRHNGQGHRSDAISHYRVGIDLIRRPGATIHLEAEPAILDLSANAGYRYTLTVTHPSIDTTVYQSLTDGTAPLTQVFKFAGDSSLPEDLWWRFNLPGMMPLWFDLASDDDDITGLYTLWCTYYRESSFGWGTSNKGYIHAADGTRKLIIYDADFFTTYFRIQISVPSGGAIRYNCELADWSNQNGDRFEFMLDTNTSAATVPDTLEVRRPQSGYCRTPREEDQL